MQVNNRFASLLGSRKMKISEVSRSTGISRTTLTKLYYDTSRAVSFAVLGKLCEALDCGVADILDVSRGECSGS